ncbi:hypothetical protein LNP74_04225 [Klebsiella pneumoniae subsp. pneumoniae]|nr:hypothetical protein [Klebsiella pneumoniae subsp. pneumoniae]
MNKESIFRQLEQRIAGRALTAEALGEFNAMAIADSLKQKRSIISHHLNNLHREQRVVKVNGRPVLFLPVTVLRDHHRLAVRHGEYASIQALCADRQDSLAQLIGAQGQPAGSIAPVQGCHQLPWRRSAAAAAGPYWHRGKVF